MDILKTDGKKKTEANDAKVRLRDGTKRNKTVQDKKNGLEDNEGTNRWTDRN